MFSDPAGDAFAEGDFQAIDNFEVRILGGAQHQDIAFQHIDKTGIAAYEFRNNVNDFVQDVVQRISGCDAAADSMKKLECRYRFCRFHDFMLPRIERSSHR